MQKKLNNYTDTFLEIYNERREEIDEKINKYKTKGLPKGYRRYYEWLERAFKVVGIGEIILNKDIIKTKENFYLSAYMRKVIYEKIDLERYIGDDYAYTFCEEIDSIFMALISENDDLIKSLIELSGNMKESDEILEISQIYIYNKLNAIKYILLKDFDKAKECVEKIKEISDDLYMKPYLDYEKILTAIINKNENELNKALKHLAENNHKLEEYKNSPEELFCLSALGLGKLAILSGMNVELDHPSAPKELLQKSEIVYPIIDFVD